MKDKLKQLWEFANWAVHDHLEQVRKCVEVESDCLAVRDFKRFRAASKQWKFEFAQYKRWRKYREHIERCQKMDLMQEQWQEQQKMLADVASKAMSVWSTNIMPWPNCQCRQCPYFNKHGGIFGSALGNTFGGIL